MGNQYKFRIPYLKNTCPSWRQVLHMADPLVVKKNQMISTFAKSPFDFFFIDSGLFQVREYTPNGKMRGTTIFCENTLTCVVNAILQDVFSQLDVYCMRDAKIWRFDASLLTDEDFIKKNPLLIKESMDHLSKNLMIYTVHATKMLGTPLQKVAQYFLALENEIITNNFNLKLTQQEIADLLDIHRITYTRTLKELVQNGCITYSNKKEVKVINKVLLESFV